MQSRTSVTSLPATNTLNFCNKHKSTPMEANCGNTLANLRRTCPCSSTESWSSSSWGSQSIDSKTSARCCCWHPSPAVLALSSLAVWCCQPPAQSNPGPQRRLGRTRKQGNTKYARRRMPTQHNTHTHNSPARRQERNILKNMFEMTGAASRRTVPCAWRGRNIFR